MGKKHKLVLVGDSVFAQVAYEFFTHDSEYEVVAFSVERDYLKRERFCGLPVVAFENLESLYAPAEHFFFAAVVFTQLNRLRARLYREAKAKGYGVASYVSTHALVRESSEVGEHCFICESTVIQPRAKIGDNVVLWSGNYIGHHAIIKSNCFTLPNVVISESVEVGANCVIGANATLAENVRVDDDCQVEAGALVTENIVRRQQAVN